MVNGKGPAQIFVRDWGLWLLQKVPPVKHWLERGPRNESAVQYQHAPGLPFIPELGGGLFFPQTYCIGVQPGSTVQFTDDVIFGQKNACAFQIVVLLNDFQELDSAISDLAGLVPDELIATEATFFVPRTQCQGEITHPSPLFRTATGLEFARSPLCLSRPEPYGYDERLMWKAAGGARYVILRFDRFVFAFCKTKAELDKSVAEVKRLF